MPEWLQHTLALALVAFCLGVVAREGLKVLRRKASRIAGCGPCKGCDTGPASASSTDAKPTAPAGERVAFIPADSLTARVASRYKH